MCLHKGAISRSCSVNTYLSNSKELSSVAEAPVTKFMTQDGNDFLSLALLNQGIIDDNVLFPRQAVEVRVAVSTPLAAINDIQLMERELELPGKALNACLQFSGFQRRELVEQWQDDNGVDGDSEDLNEDTKEPEVVEERVASLLHDLKHRADDRGSQHNS